MDTSTLITSPLGSSAATSPDLFPPAGGQAAGLGAEVRESLFLLSFAVGVTVGLTTAAQAALAVLS